MELIKQIEFFRSLSFIVSYSWSIFFARGGVGCATSSFVKPNSDGDGIFSLAMRSILSVRDLDARRFFGAGES